MRINEDGTVGIGVTATDRLHVDADAAQDALRVQVSGSTKLRVFADGTVAVGTPSDVAYAFFVSTNSAAKPTSSAWTVSSDRRLKTNVEPFEDGLGVVQKINPVWFRYNGKAGMPVDERGVGTIAQELMKIAPYMISPFSAKDEEGNDVTYYGVDYGAMDFVLINSIKDQQKQIENLEEQIGELVNINELLIKILSGKDGHLEKAEDLNKKVLGGFEPNMSVSREIKEYRMNDNIGAEFNIPLINTIGKGIHEDTEELNQTKRQEIVTKKEIERKLNMKDDDSDK